MQYRLSYFRFPKFHFDNTHNLRLLYANRVLRDVVNKISFFFLPIFLYNMGTRIDFLFFKDLLEIQRGISFVGIFYIVTSIASLSVVIPVGKLTSKIGHHKMLMLSYFLRLGMFIVFYFGVDSWKMILAASVINGIQNDFFWPGFYTEILKDAQRENMGKDLGLLQVLLQVVAAISPAVSGFLAVAYGMDIVFLLGLFGTLGGVVLTVKLDHIKEKDTVSFSEFFSWLKEYRFQKLALSIIGKQIHDMVIFLWPLYVFFILGTVDKVGYLYTFSLFTALVLTLFIGSYVDKHSNKKPFFLSGGFLSGLWIARIWVFTPLSIALVDMSEKIVSNFHWLFFDRVLFTRGKGSQAYSYFVYREMMVMIAILLFWLTVVSLFYFGVGWNAIFTLGAVGVLMSVMIKEKLPL